MPQPKPNAGKWWKSKSKTHAIRYSPVNLGGFKSDGFGGIGRFSGLGLSNFGGFRLSSFGGFTSGSGLGRAVLGGLGYPGLGGFGELTRGGLRGAGFPISADGDGDIGPRARSARRR